MATTHAQTLAKDQAKKAFDQLSKIQQELAAAVASYKTHENVCLSMLIHQWHLTYGS